jgi:hypothetical protein
VKDTVRSSQYYRKQEPVNIEVFPQPDNARNNNLNVVLQEEEWVKYTVKSPKSQSYKTVLKAKSVGKSAVVEMLIGNKAKKINLRNEWTEINLTSFPFESGQNNIQLNSLKGEVAIDWIEFKE